MLAFVDESGDPGTLGRGSRWFVWRSVVVAERDADGVRALVRAACERAGDGRYRPFHATEFGHDDLHGMIEHCLDPRWTAVIVASDTVAVDGAAYVATPRHRAYYAARFLLERLSAFAVQLGERASVFIEDSRTMDESSFRAYVSKFSGTGERTVDPRHLAPSDVHVIRKGEDELLYLADLVSYSAYRALEPNRKWRRLERSYFDAIAGAIWQGPCGREDIRTWGLVTMPTAAASRHVAEYPFLERLARETE
jgi:hypothetical protein